jgi:NADP-dependent 3-hydroxy acid dehydrogenase YdfG
VTIKESSEQQLKSHPEITYLETEDIANATLYILGTPQNVQVNIYKIYDNYYYSKRLTEIYFCFSFRYVN